VRVGVAAGLVCIAGCADRPLELPESRSIDLGAIEAPDLWLGGAVDLHARDLTGADLRSSDFASSDFASSDFASSDFASSDLASSDLTIADLTRPDLLLPGNCGDNDVLVGTACVKRSCQVGDSRLNCLMPDGTIGDCANTTCTKIDFLNDPNNCGFFGDVCPAGTPCTDGFCYGACGAMSCPPGLSCSAYGCVLPSCDGAHDYQACTPLIGQFIYWRQCCGTACIDILDDPNNCGYCGHRCPGSARCNFGVCDVDCSQAIDNTPCGAGTGYCCQGQCVFNGNGCGCGATCWTNCTSRGCSAGQTCVEYASGTVCAPTSCARLPEGDVCATNDADGAAQAGYCCGGSCMAFSTDADNCGACGRRCPAGEICVGGNCVPPVECVATADATPCPLPNGVQGMCCGGACVDVHTDASNCGSCARVCPTGSTCQPASTAFGNAQCVDGSGAAITCDATHPCPTRYSCFYGVCQPDSCTGVADGTRCTNNGLCCSGVCVSAQDLSNCGGCGRGCPLGTSRCAFGECLDSRFNPISCSATAPCPSGNSCVDVGCTSLPGCEPYQCLPPYCAGRSDGVACAFGRNTAGNCCGGACVNTARDPDNCGQCGRDCGSSLCAAGICLVGAETRCLPDCPAGTICYQVGPFDGGSRLGVCVGPVCGLITYNNPQLNSGRCLAQDGTLGLCCADGTCADITNDPLNCGGCGIDCAGAACVTGSCVGAQCDYAHEGGFCGTAGECIQGKCQ
jgi:hypothetical protein